MGRQQQHPLQWQGWEIVVYYKQLDRDSAFVLSLEVTIHYKQNDSKTCQYRTRDNLIVYNLMGRIIITLIAESDDIPEC